MVININLERLREQMKAEEKMDESVKALRPVFTGRTDEGEEITLYQHMDRPEEIHILLPDDSLHKLEGSAVVSTWADPTKSEMRVDVNSRLWTGQARGSKWETLAEHSR